VSGVHLTCEEETFTRLYSALISVLAQTFCGMGGIDDGKSLYDVALCKSSNLFPVLFRDGSIKEFNPPIQRYYQYRIPGLPIFSLIGPRTIGSRMQQRMPELANHVGPIVRKATQIQSRVPKMHISEAERRVGLAVWAAQDLHTHCPGLRPRKVTLVPLTQQKQHEKQLRVASLYSHYASGYRRFSDERIKFLTQGTTQEANGLFLSTPGTPVFHCLPQFGSFPGSLSSHEVAKVLEPQLQDLSFHDHGAQETSDHILRSPLSPSIKASLIPPHFLPSSFLHNPAHVCNLVSGSSASSKTYIKRRKWLQESSKKKAALSGNGSAALLHERSSRLTAPRTSHSGARYRAPVQGERALTVPAESHVHRLHPP
ncbi:GAT domain-containing protein, partial [Podarcis lilfordi]